MDVSVRFCETDSSGYVNATSYFIYLEEARAKFFDTNGYGANNRESTLNFIIATTKCDFFRQADFHQQIKITTSVAKVGNKSFQIIQEMTCESGFQIAVGETVIVCFDFKEQATFQIPDSLRMVLEKNLQAS
ncbi:thioesterase family protein [Bacillus sp. V59.32b]|uniref:acyl-CoA thioesterase n=1 Tax=Bacillus sp. V59.32b TaxID=1758642 RepID=UPI000E3C3E12|nr:thioesterase family protein [Bacillus sp. V59.32b]RFU64165.1 acyl-CoA thioesterase [Bacillus sp. V59.32b]